MLKKLGYVGALLTCPCHVVLLLLLLGGTAAGAWMAAHMGLAFSVFAAAFLFFLWLATRSERVATDGPVGTACEPCVPGDAAARGAPSDITFDRAGHRR